MQKYFTFFEAIFVFLYVLLYYFLHFVLIDVGELSENKYRIIFFSNLAVLGGIYLAFDNDSNKLRKGKYIGVALTCFSIWLMYYFYRTTGFISFRAGIAVLGLGGGLVLSIWGTMNPEYLYRENSILVTNKLASNCFLFGVLIFLIFGIGISLYSLFA